MNLLKKIYKKILKEVTIIKSKKIWKNLNQNNFVKIGEVNWKFFLNDLKENKYSIGKNTYGILNLHSSGSSDEKLIIGNNCSISGRSHFLLGGNHNYNYISTYPYKNKIIGSNEPEAFSKGAIIIEDEVWIGDEALILSGVTIEKGAIVAAGSVVTKNVPAYAIVAGNPAKLIKYRFSDNIINKIKDIDLYKYDFDKKNIDVIYQELTDENVDMVVENIKRIGKNNYV